MNRGLGFRSNPPADKEPVVKKPRPKKCAICREPFVPRNMMHKVCGPECSQTYAERVRKAQERKADRERKVALKTRRDWLKDAQIWFNKAVRARDQKAGYACISSGRPLDWSGNAVDCGHYRSVGSAPHLRFHFDNAHAQSKMDNQFLAGNAVDYRIGLIARIGLERVEALEADNEPRKWSVDELKAMIVDFKRMVKEMKNG